MFLTIFDFSCLFSVFSRIHYCPHFIHSSVRHRYHFSWGYDPMIAYDPRTQMTEGFFWPVLDPVGGVWSPNSVYFHINTVFFWYLRMAICKMISKIVFLISKSVFLISNAIIYFDQQELFFWSASFIFLSSRINFLVSKNLNDIKTKFLKGKFTSKCEIF